MSTARSPLEVGSVLQAPSPISRLEELLDNPRSGYPLKKFGNPYRHLHWTEESADEYMKIVNEEI